MKYKNLKVLSLLVILLLPLNVLALNIKGEAVTKSDITKEEDLTVSIKLTQEGNNKIDVFQGIIDFDENIFEIDEKSFEVQNGWADYQYNKDTHALIVINKYGSTLNEDIIKFNLKLKDNINPKSTSIKLNDMIVANEDEDIKLNNSSSLVSINLRPSELNNNRIEESFTSNTLVSKPVRIYYTLILILLELVIAIVLVLLYKTAMKRISSVGQKRALIATLCLIEIVSASAFFGIDATKGDLNKDKSISYNDVEALASHLINSNFLSNFTLERADMNGDGKITPNDLSILLRKTYAKTEYAATLTDAIMESNAYEKSSIIDLRFLANVTDDELVEYVLIDGKKYHVEKSNKNKNEYIIKIPLKDQSKEYNYNVTEVILANGRSAKVDYKTNVMVLKDAPMLSGFATREDLQNGKMSVALTITDNDNAIVNSYYELVDSNGNVVKKGNLNKGKNALELSLDNAVSYKFNIKIDYNRGSNSGEYYGSIEDSYDLKIVTDYRFQMSNLKLIQNGVATKNLEKDTPTTLTFKSSNVSGYAPKKVNIAGKEYPVSSLGGGTYRVNIPNTILNGSPLTISKVILSNGKIILTKISTNYKVLHKKPIVDNLNIFEDANNSLLNINFNVIDNDKTLDNVKINIYDDKGTLINSEIITDGNYNKNISVKDSSNYTVKVFASYHLITGSNDFVYKDILLNERNIKAVPKAYINSHTTENIYPDKNSIIRLDYNITSNYNESVKQIVVNNIIYEAKKAGINTYFIEVPIDEYAGIKEYSTQKVILANNLEANVNTSIKVDVLKDYPVLDNLEIVENIEESKINMVFDFFDNDNAFTKGEVRLTNKETGEIIKSENIILGKNNIEFLLENAIKYNIDVVIDAILDTRELNAESPNIITDYNMYSNEYRIIKDYKLEVTDIDSYKDDKIDFYFDKNESIELRFKSTNVSEYIPIKVKVDGIYYDVENIDDLYKFTINPFEEAGVKVLKFESVILSNMKEINIDCTKKIEILKSTPVITEVETTEDQSNVTIKLNIEDNDNVLNNLKAIVTDKEGNIVFENTIDKELTFTKAENNKYIIKVYGDYDLDSNELSNDQNEFKEKELFTKTIE